MLIVSDPPLWSQNNYNKSGTVPPSNSQIITHGLLRENVEKLHINATLINSKCHPALWITYCRNVRKSLRMWERLTFFWLISNNHRLLSFYLFFFKCLHFNILKGHFRVFFFLFCQTYFRVSNAESQTGCPGDADSVWQQPFSTLWDDAVKVCSLITK